MYHILRHSMEIPHAWYVAHTGDTRMRRVTTRQRVSGLWPMTSALHLRCGFDSEQITAICGR
jgi:hypothetical protein